VDVHSAGDHGGRSGNVPGAIEAEAMHVEAKKRILILGGGFAGAYTALHLEQRFAGLPDVEIVLVSKENFLLFTPMLHEVAGSDVSVTDIVQPLRKMLRRTLVHPGEVILPELGESLGRYAQKKLTERGVEIRLKTKIVGYDGREVTLDGGDRIPTRIGIACAVLRIAVMGEVISTEEVRRQDQQGTADPCDDVVQPAGSEGGAMDAFMQRREERREQ